MSPVPSEERIWNLLRGALATRALAIAADLHVAEALADGPRHVSDLADASGVDADALRRVLRALASDGVFSEDEPGVFRNTDSSALLTRSGWGEFASLFGDVWYRSLTPLDASGRATFPEIFGTDFWSWLAKNPREREQFDIAMAQGQDERVERLAKLHWRGDETIVDVGGGNGSLLIEFLDERPGMRGMVYDLPETVRDESAFGDRIEFVAGSFFESVPEGDVYLLATILHDWDDESATRILQTIRAVAATDARLIILDAVVPPGNEPFGSKWLDLLMLALFAGRERDEVQWRTLLAGGGFEPVRFNERLIEARCR